MTLTWPKTVMQARCRPTDDRSNMLMGSAPLRFGDFAEDRSLLVILLEAHQGLWSQLSAETDGTEDSRHLTVVGFLQQVIPIMLAQSHVSDAPCCGHVSILLHSGPYNKTLCRAGDQMVVLQVLVFVNAFLSLNDANQVAVIGMTSTSRWISICCACSVRFVVNCRT